MRLKSKEKKRKWKRGEEKRIGNQQNDMKKRVINRLID